MTDQKPCIFLAAGGTGGHIFPAKALAQLLMKQEYKVICITDKRHNFFDETIHTERLDMLPLSGGIIAFTKGLRSLVRSMIQMWKISVREKPALLVTFGGYTTLPSVFIAMWKGIPIIVHEQNSVLGKTNRLVASVAKVVAVAYEMAHTVPPEFHKKMVVVGNPVREEIKALQQSPFPHTDSSGILRILVIGGSQGARILSNVVPQAIAQLSVADKKCIYIEQQCRPEDVERVSQMYTHMNVAATVVPFFQDIGMRLSKAHLVIGRAGASFLAELTLIGRAAILVPFAKASHNHQLENAKVLQKKKAAYVIEEHEFTPQILAEYFRKCIQSKKMLEDMAKNAATLGIADADQRLADVVQSQLGRGSAMIEEQKEKMV